MRDPEVQPTARLSAFGDNTQDHDQTSTHDCNKATRPRSSGFCHLRERLSARISPPPLKRQCTGSGISSAVLGGQSATVLPIRLSGPREVNRRPNDASSFHVRPIHKGSKGDRVSDYSRHSSSSFPASSVDRNQGSLNRDATPRNSDGGRSDPSSRTPSSRKPICRVCEKSFATNYNPIITCPGCERPYHDSCRRPLLVDGVDPLQWRCSKCLSGNLSRRSSSFAAPAPKASSVLSSSRLAGRGTRGPKVDNDQRSSLHHPQTNISHSSESLNVPSDTDRKSPNVCSEIQRDFPNSVSLDTCNDPGAGFSERLRGDVKATDVSTVRPSVSSDQIALLDLSDDKVLGTSVVEPGKSEKNRQLLKLSNSHIPERTEIPNTPTQRSSQLDIPSSAPKQRFAHTAVASVDIASPLTKPHQSEETTSLTILCSVCRKQRILAKNTNDSITCRNCRNRSLIVEAGKLEIPETPDGTPAYDASARSSPTVSATKHVPTLWFQSELVSSKPNIVKKKVRDNETPCASHQSLEHTNELGTVMDMLQTTNIAEQVLVRKSELAVKSDPSQNDTPAKGTHSAGVQAMPLSCPRELGDKNHATIPLPTSESSVNSTQGPLSIESPDRRDNDPVIQRAHMVESGIAEPGSMQSKLIASEPMTPSSMARSSSASRPPTDTGSESPPVSPIEKHYTIREMARIALVAANGAHLTTSQIASWIASTFPHLLKGEVEWEKSLVIKLSSKPEFRSQEIVGVQGKRTSWDFADTKVRARCERKYAVYHSGSNSATRMLRKSLGKTKSAETVKEMSLGNKQVVSQHMKADQITPTYPGAASDIPTTISKAPLARREMHVSPTKRNDSRYMPFERSTPRQPQSLSNITYNTKRETSLYKIYFQNQTLPVEAMKPEEKAAKIAEIKRRPSRKHFFGSDHRLAHVRRYGRQDIHDESDGAWKPSRSNRGETKSELDKDVAMADRKETRYLREVFDLPENVIPMNDGQTELAFRDGTLINGRLPRPRQIYRVGKLFGGELTIRTS